MVFEFKLMNYGIGSVTSLHFKLSRLRTLWGQGTGVLLDVLDELNLVPVCIVVAALMILTV